MADLKAGSLNVEITADNKPLNEGLRKAEQQVKKTDDKLKQLTRTTSNASDAAGGGFFEATGKVQQFQSQVSAALGVVAGFTAVATIVGGVAKAFREVGDEVGRSRDVLDSFEKLLRSTAKNTPVLGQILQVGFDVSEALTGPGREAGTQKNISELQNQIRNIEGQLRRARDPSAFFTVGDRPGGSEVSRLAKEQQELQARLNAALATRRAVEAELSARAGLVAAEAEQLRLGLESEALRLQGKDAEADLLDIQKEEKKIAEEINRLTTIRNQLLDQGFNRLGATVDNQIRALEAAKKQTIELKKQAVIQKTVGDIFTGQTAAGAFKVALSVAKSTASSATTSPSSPQGKQVTLLQEATRLLGIIANKETALT
jgi:hypothetical protein